METMIGVLLILLILLMLRVSAGVVQPSFTTLSGVDSTRLANVIDDAINYCGKAVERPTAFYQDFVASNKIVYFFNYYIPADQKPGMIMPPGCCFVGLWGYVSKRMKK